MKLKRVLLVLVIGLMAGTAVIRLLTMQTVLAQTQNIYVDKQLGRDDPTVHVGEYLTFTIYIENRSAFTVTTLPLSDTFNTGVLAFVDAVPAPDSVNGSTGRLDWTDLTTYFGDLGPGESVLVVTGFIAEHPAPAVVNAAEVHDAVNNIGELEGGGDTSDDGESIGGSSPVDKSLLNGVVPEVGLPLTFTIRITNSGFITMTTVPLLEDYDPAYLRFEFAIPQPDAVDEVMGELVWSDLTTWLGDVPPHEAVQVLVVFTALAPIDVTTNSAGVSGATDWYGNELAAGADQVPITIVEEGQATATPTPTATTAATTPTATTQAATPTATSDNSDSGSTPVSHTATPVQITSTPERPAEIAATGIPPQPINWAAIVLLGAVLLLPVAIWWGWRHTRPSA